MFPMKLATSRLAEIDYTNWRGERAVRKIIPICIFYASNTYHKDEQWLLEAIDHDKGEIRIFAMNKIHSWKAAESKDAVPVLAGQSQHVGSNVP